MSKIVLDCESLNKVIEGKNINFSEAMQVFDISKKNPDELFKTSQNLRRKYKSNIVSFSKKAFFNIINLCRDTCSYCTYKSEPFESKLSMMSENDVRNLAKLAKKYHCTEALFVTGERPEQKYEETKQWLGKMGFKSTPEYLIHCSQIALDEGLFPHTNAGNLTKDEMRELKKTNPSIGLMLESSSKRLTEKNMPHHLAPSKEPETRLNVIESAGKIGIPLTTGLLVGIGETEVEIIESIFAIKKVHEKYGNIQEVIIQNFHPKPKTLMARSPSAEENYFKKVVALARIVMPKMNIQIPPNLSPASYPSFLSTGINDWGGISPLTQDYVNPGFSWPKIKDIEQNCKAEGFELKARFPVYPEFFSFVNTGIKEKMFEVQEDSGYVSEDYWR